MRKAVFCNINASPLSGARLNPPVTWFGWVVLIPLQLAIAVGSGMVMLGVAIMCFDRAD